MNNIIYVYFGKYNAGSRSHPVARSVVRSGDVVRFKGTWSGTKWEQLISRSQILSGPWKSIRAMVREIHRLKVKPLRILDDFYLL